MSSEAAELEKFVMFETLGKRDVVEVVAAIYRITEGLVVLFFDKERVVCLVDSSDVKLEIYTHQIMSEYVERQLTCWTAMRYERIRGMWSI